MKRMQMFENQAEKGIKLNPKDIENLFGCLHINASSIITVGSAPGSKDYFHAYNWECKLWDFSWSSMQKVRFSRSGNVSICTNIFTIVGLKIEMKKDHLTVSSML